MLGFSLRKKQTQQKTLMKPKCPNKLGKPIGRANGIMVFRRVRIFKKRGNTIYNLVKISTNLDECGARKWTCLFDPKVMAFATGDDTHKYIEGFWFSKGFLQAKLGALFCIDSSAIYRWRISRLIHFYRNSSILK